MRFLRSLVPALLLIVGMLAAPTPGMAALSVGISVGFAPPPLPIYAQASDSRARLHLGIWVLGLGP